MKQPRLHYRNRGCPMFHMKRFGVRLPYAFF